jgi:hypothetical protein
MKKNRIDKIKRVMHKLIKAVISILKRNQNHI